MCTQHICINLTLVYIDKRSAVVGCCVWLLLCSVKFSVGVLCEWFEHERIINNPNGGMRGCGRPIVWFGIELSTSWQQHRRNVQINRIHPFHVKCVFSPPLLSQFNIFYKVPEIRVAFFIVYKCLSSYAVSSESSSTHHYQTTSCNSRNRRVCSVLESEGIISAPFTEPKSKRIVWVSKP